MDKYVETVVLTNLAEKGKGKRRASFEIRRSNIARHNAVAIQLIVPGQFLTMPGTWDSTLDGPRAGVPPPFKPRSEVLSEFSKMQRKLYLVTRDGCLLPHYSWGSRGAGNIAKGYQLMMDAYYGWRPEGGGVGVAEVSNSRGWSEVLQASHLCHLGPACCNPTHVIAEPRWRNLKRNYCGVVDGVCDCCQGLPEPWNKFPCLHSYRSLDYDAVTAMPGMILTDPNQVREALDNFDCPGFFRIPDTSASPLAGVYVENVHWKFISDSEFSKITDADAIAAAKLNAKRAKK